MVKEEYEIGDILYYFSGNKMSCWKLVHKEVRHGGIGSFKLKHISGNHNFILEQLDDGIIVACFSAMISFKKFKKIKFKPVKFNL